MKSIKKIFVLFSIFLGCLLVQDSMVYAARSKFLSDDECFDLISDALYHTHIELYANLDGGKFLKSPCAEYVIRGINLPKSFTQEKASSFCAGTLDEETIAQLRDPAQILQVKVDGRLIRHRGPFSEKACLGDRIDVEVNHEQDYIKVLVEREPVLYRLNQESYCAMKVCGEVKENAEYIFAWYQLHHQA